MKFKLIMFSSIIFFLLTACDSAETLVNKGVDVIGEDEDSGIYDEKALNYFDKAIKKDSNYASAYLQRGKINLKYGWAKCKDDFYKCTELDPGNVEAWKIIASEESNSEQDKKIAAAVKALELDLEFFEAYLIIGKIATTKNNLDKAEEYLIYYLKKMPSDKSINNALGELRLKQKRYYESYEFFQKGFYPDDYNYKALYHIKNAAREGNTEAKEYLVNINETDSAFFDEAKLLFEKKEYDKAMYKFRIAKDFTEFNIYQRADIIAYIAKIRSIQASNGKYDYENSTALENQGRKRAFETAEREVESSLKIRKTAFAYGILGDIKFQQGFYKEAITVLDSAILLEKNNADLYINRAWAWHRISKHSKAIDDINKAISLSGSNDYYLWFRAEVYRISGKNAEALNDYNKLLKSDSKSYNALKGLAELEIQSGNYFKAYTHMQKVIEYHGKFQWIKEAMDEIPENELLNNMRNFKNSL